MIYRTINKESAMKMLVVIFTLTLFALCTGNAIPLPNGDNSQYEEGVSQYTWMADDNGVPHLIDLEAPVDYDFLATRNGANNQYWLFTRNNRNSRQVLVNNDINSVRNSNYLATRPTVVIMHGWLNNGNSEVNTEIKAAVLDTLDANVIVVDWSSVAGNWNYNTVVNGVPSVGQYTGNFLTWLINNAGGNWNNVHIVGHSLGGHAAGNAGRQTGGRVARVTGLDSAGPGWQSNSQAIKKGDAQYVEGIHTDGNSNGIKNAYADADFYPNGGVSPQPGCSNSGCSHGRAHEFFASSVRTNHFVGIGCTNQNQAANGNCNGISFNMGNNVLTKRGSGIYYLKTGSSFPY